MKCREKKSIIVNNVIPEKNESTLLHTKNEIAVARIEFEIDLDC